MPTWIPLMIIVLVSVALFADGRRNGVDGPLDMTGYEEFPNAASDPMFRPNVRDGHQNGHLGSVPRPLSVRRAERDVRKNR